MCALTLATISVAVVCEVRAAGQPLRTNGGLAEQWISHYDSKPGWKKRSDQPAEVSRQVTKVQIRIGRGRQGNASGAGHLTTNHENSPARIARDVQHQLVRSSRLRARRRVNECRASSGTPAHSPAGGPASLPKLPSIAETSGAGSCLFPERPAVSLLLRLSRLREVAASLHPLRDLFPEGTNPNSSPAIVRRDVPELRSPRSLQMPSATEPHSSTTAPAPAFCR